MKTRLFVLAVLILAFAALAMAADDPFVGTWKMNAVKSKSPDPMPKSYIVKITAIDNGIKIAEDLVDADGKSSHSDQTWICDGKDRPSSSNPRLTRSYTRVDANTIVMVSKVDGKEVGRMVDSLSKDGKTGTITTKGKNAMGQDIDTLFTWDRQ